MQLYKRGRIYWIRWGEDGRKFRESTGCDDKKAAILALRRRQRELADPHHAAANQATVASAAVRFLRELKKTCSSSGTLNMYECKVGHVVRLLGEKRLSRLAHSDVLTFTEVREEETAAPHTVHRELTALRLILKSAARAGEFPRDPKTVLPRYAARYVPRTRWLTENELLAVCAQLEPRRAAVLAFMVATSARFGEAFRAQRGDIRHTGILVRGTKTGKALRTVPVLGVMWPLVAFTLEHASGKGDALFEPWTNMLRDVKRACLKAKIVNCTANDLRRTTATWLVKQGVPLNLIAKVLGHANTRMLELVYGQLDSADVGRLIDAHTSGHIRSTAPAHAGAMH